VSPSPEDQTLQRLGIDRGYHDYKGEWRDVPTETLEAIVQLMHVDADSPSVGARVIKVGESSPVPDATELRTEDGGSEALDGLVPPDVPAGYHELVDLTDGTVTRLIVSPGSCYLPDDFFTWGWATQLYALRSEGSWGQGDLADLRQLGRFTRYLGGGMSMINPLHAANPTVPQETSPYYPSSRWFRNPLYLRVEEVPGADALPDIDRLAVAGRALNANPRVDRDEIFRLKMEALGHLWERFGGDERFDEYLSDQGPEHEGLATFMALAETNEGAWDEWAEELRKPHGAGVERFKSENYGRIRFHQWTQWLLDEQLATASTEVAMVHDLAVGVAPGGADSWLWQDMFATGVSIGAPADDYAVEGQGWGVRAFDPWKLRAVGYEPFIRTLRSSMRHAGGIRIDHVMGLWRLFWIPDGVTAKDGAYVRYPVQDLLDIVALESHRAEAFVIGEDLGTVEPVVREEMAARKMLSYKVLWFEGGSPDTYPELSLATPNNHDLPTTAGLWSGKDIELLREAGVDAAEDFSKETRKGLAEKLHVSDDASVAEVVDRTYEELATAPSAVVTAFLEDALEMVERYNRPGTSGEWNWSTTLPQSLEEIEQHPRVRAIAEQLTRRIGPGEEGNTDT
jgi:4-alpha-glucanotransferase